jgi:hypothetical protein
MGAKEAKKKTKRTVGPVAHKNPAAVQLARLRAASLTPERRSEIARKAVRTRWEKQKKK